MDGRTRTYTAHLPTGYDHVRRVPLLLAFHGAGGGGQGMQSGTGLDAFADGAGFAVAYPDAVARWAEGCGCTDADALGVDDVAFVRRLIAHLTRRYAIDRERVYATGFSQGAFFAQRLACEADPPVVALATVGATMREGLSRSCGAGGLEAGRPLPALLLHGTLDATLPPEGTESGAASTLSFAEAGAFWAELGMCAGSPRVEHEPRDPTASPRLRIEIHERCAPGTEVRIVVGEGLRHEWPLAATNPSGIDASALVTEFLARVAGGG